MKKILLTVTCVLGLGTAASAATLDFLGEGNANERNAENEILTFGGVRVQLDASSTQGTDDFAYLDAGAGLGTCQTLSCEGTNDDNIDRPGEWVRLTFLDGPVDLTNFTFRNANHSLITEDQYVRYVDSNGRTQRREPRLRFSVNGDPLEGVDFDDILDESLTQVTSIRFGYDGRRAIPFYLSSVEAEVSVVPVPAALPLLLAGIGGLGVMSRRRKRTA